MTLGGGDCDIIAFEFSINVSNIQFLTFFKKVEKMQGKILGFDDLQGAIRGDDGKRYHFDISEVKNAKNADLETLSGSEVDFELANGKAVEIYITKFQQNTEFIAFKNANFSPNSSQSANSQNQNSQNNFTSPNSQQNFKMPQKPEVKALKNKFYIALGILIGGTILAGSVGGIISLALTGDKRLGDNIVSLFVFLLYFILFYNITKFVQEHSRSDTLVRNFTLYNGIFITCWAISLAILADKGGDTQGVLIFNLIIYVVTLFIKYSYYDELAEITTQPLFMYAFWCNASIILSPIGFILWIMAWVGVKKIRVYDIEK